MKASCRFVAALTASWFATSSLEAQGLCGPNELGAWWPRGSGGNRQVTAAERAIGDPNLLAAEEIVRKTSYGTPRGFAVRPLWGYSDLMTKSRSWGHGNPTRNPLRSYAYLTLIFHGCARGDEYGSGITIVFNPDPLSWSEGDRSALDENGDGLYYERVRSEPLFGSTATYGHFAELNGEGIFVLFTVGGESPTVPVTREEYLRAVIFGLEGKDQSEVKKTLEAISKTQYERWKEGAAERKKQREQIVAGAASVDPAKAAKVRADLENADRVAGEAHLKNEPAERAELEKMRANVTAGGDKMRARIAAMTPAERAAPAYVYETLLDVAPAGTPNAKAVVRVNPEFYRTRRTPLEPRAILVRIRNDDYLPEQLQQMYREFDWSAIKRLLTTTP